MLMKVNCELAFVQASDSGAPKLGKYKINEIIILCLP